MTLIAAELNAGVIQVVTVYVASGKVPLYPHFLGSRFPPAPLRRQLGVNHIQPIDLRQMREIS